VLGMRLGKVRVGDRSVAATGGWEYVRAGGQCTHI
jgi:hypothetical protein